MRPFLLLILLTPWLAQATGDSPEIPPQPLSFWHFPLQKHRVDKQSEALAAQITPAHPLLSETLPDVTEQLGAAMYYGLWHDFYRSSDETVAYLQRALAAKNRLDPNIVDVGVEEAGLLLFGVSPDGRYNPFRQWVRRVLVYSPLCVIPTPVKPFNDFMFHKSIVEVLALMRDAEFEFDQQASMLRFVLQLAMEVSKRPEYLLSVMDSLTFKEFKTLNYKVLNDAVENTRRGRLWRTFELALSERYQALLQVEGRFYMFALSKCCPSR